jgi:hypothetical protein
MCDIQRLDIHTAFHQHLDQPVQNSVSQSVSYTQPAESFTLLRHHELPPLVTGLSQLIPEQRILDIFGRISCTTDWPIAMHVQVQANQRAIIPVLEAASLREGFTSFKWTCRLHLEAKVTSYFETLGSTVMRRNGPHIRRWSHKIII